MMAHRVILSLRLFLIACCILIYFLGNHTPFFIIYFLLIGYITLYIAYVPAGIMRRYNKFGDYSYGMYIYAFPVQQSVAALIENISVARMVMLSFSVTLVLAIFSWHLIEKPMLAKKYLLPDLLSKLILNNFQKNNLTN